MKKILEFIPNLLFRPEKTILKSVVSAPSQDKKTVTKTDLYKLFKIMSISIMILLTIFTFKIIQTTAPSHYDGEFAGYVGAKGPFLPLFIIVVLILYISLFIKVVLEKTPYRESYYGIAFTTCCIILLNLVIAYEGTSAIFLILFFLPSYILMLSALKKLGLCIDINIPKNDAIKLFILAIIVIILQIAPILLLFIKQ